MKAKKSTNAFCLGPKTDLHPYLTGHKYELSSISLAKLQGHVMSTFASSPMFPKRLGSESIKNSVELRFSSLSCSFRKTSGANPDAKTVR